MRCLELYCGIGGFSVAAATLKWHVVRAVDINRHAIDVFRHNFDHRATIGSVESIAGEELRALQTDFWWLSPPCQPFTARGKQRDLADPRSTSLLKMLGRLSEILPAALALENVPGFASSRAADCLRDVLGRAGYAWREVVLCPTQFGVPNRRRRFYLVASRHGRPSLPPIASSPKRLQDLLDAPPHERLTVADDFVRSYRGAIDIVDASDPAAVCSCFTSAYGRSHVRSGSYLTQQGRVRRFSPTEMLRLLGFPPSFQLPSNRRTSTAWKLIGNSLSIPVITHVLRSLQSEQVHRAA